MPRRSLLVATLLGCLLVCLGAPTALGGFVAAADAPGPTPTPPDGSNDVHGKTWSSNQTAGVTNLTTGVANLTTGVTNATVEETGNVLGLADFEPDRTDLEHAAAPSNGTADGVDGDGASGDEIGGANDDGSNDHETAVARWANSTTDEGASDETIPVDEGRLRGLVNGTLGALGPLNGTRGTDRLLNGTRDVDRLPDGERFSDGGTPAPDEDGAADRSVVEPDDRVGWGNDSVASSLQNLTDVVGALQSVSGVTDLSLSELLAGLAPGPGSTEWPALDRWVAELDDDDTGEPAGVDLAVDDAVADGGLNETSDPVSEPTPSDPDAGHSDSDDGGATGGDERSGDDGEADGGAGGDRPGSGAGAGAAMVLTVGCLGGSRTAVDQAAVLASPGSRTALTAIRQAVGLHLGQLADRVVPAVFGISRLADSDALENDTRAEIFELVCESPGTYHAQLAAETDVTEETVRYHSRVLDDEGLVESRKHRGRRRLYPVTTGEDDAELSAAMADSAASDVLSTIERREPTTLTSIAEALDCAPSTVSYHLDRLEADGLVSRERDGGSVTVELRTSTRSALKSPVADD